jgi:hypothetical protein
VRNKGPRESARFAAWWIDGFVEIAPTAANAIAIFGGSRAHLNAARGDGKRAARADILRRAWDRADEYAVIEYLAHDEERDYRNYCNEGGNLIDKSGADHIWLNIQNVERWLNTFSQIQKLNEQDEEGARAQMRRLVPARTKAAHASRPTSIPSTC